VVKLLADTSAILALVLRDDRNHAAAATFLRNHPEARFVWTELILGEVATRLRALVRAPRAVAVARELLRSRRYELLLADADILDASLGHMGRFQDHRLSLADCASFEVIRRLRLDAAFAFDQDFVACGFPMVP
jgi:predicted nucleic acid-binding protein